MTTTQQWTTTPPTVEDCDGGGWYWVSVSGGSPRVVEVEQWDDGRLYVYPAGKPVEESGYRWWPEPIPEPPMPPVVGEMMTTPYITFRDDGWPLCPWCGQDELWSDSDSNSFADRIAAIHGCYYCHWTPGEEYISTAILAGQS